MLLSSYASAAPMPVQFMVNSELKECGTFWGGDEFTIIEPPAGWEDYNQSLYIYQIMDAVLPYDPEYAKIVCNGGEYIKKAEILPKTPGFANTTYKAEFTPTHRITVYGSSNAAVALDNNTGECGELKEGKGYEELPLQGSYLLPTDLHNSNYTYSQERAASIFCEKIGYKYAGRLRPSSTKSTGLAREMTAQRSIESLCACIPVAAIAALAGLLALLAALIIAKRIIRK
ncbi:MAG: hypothetical protein PHG85_03095 [Candidatus Altiarchaeota archaeon]|nr:hypothetical protein [Candidatus Altiarchaeota archaeon]